MSTGWLPVTHQDPTPPPGRYVSLAANGVVAREAHYREALLRVIHLLGECDDTLGALHEAQDALLAVDVPR